MSRSRSFWGWGWADRFPDEEARNTLRGHIKQMLGFAGDPATGAPPTLSTVRMPKPRIAPPDSLSSISQQGPLARASHTYGKSYRDIVRGFSGDFLSAPDLVLTPTDDRALEDALSWCSDNRIAAVPFGGGTSVVGGVECRLEGARKDRFSGVASIDLSAMNKVLDIDIESRLAKIQAGTFGPDIEAQLKPHNLTLRHFPQSFEFSTLGGWIATRAGGHFATLYTHIDELVASTVTLSPSGWLRTRTLPGSGAGPSPDRLMLGSEGALGIITEATMRVRFRPRFKATASVHFEKFEDAVRAARLLAQSDLYPTNCRLLDAREAMLNAVAPGNVSVLIVAFESNDHPLQPWMKRALEITEGEHGQTQGVRYKDEQSDAADKWRSAFIDAPYLQSTLVSLGIIADTFETACTWSSFFELHNALLKNVRGAMKEVCGAGLLTCRFTHVYPDGPAPYYTFIAPAKSGQALSQWKEIKARASQTLIDQGATITHHHAVGRVHRPWYEQQVPPLFLDALRSTKKTLDPAGVLNPGVLLNDTP